jgi:SAM-dependent methyltransferase
LEQAELSPGRERRFVFDEVAELYARARPTYPQALIDDVIQQSGLKPGSRILELGCGPGNASVLFAGRGYQLLSLEPGERLAAVARRRLASDPDAQVLVTTFENWPLEADAFDLVFAAQSFHWMDPVLRFSKTARALKPNGMLAAFANRALPGTGPVEQRIQQAYATHAPGLAGQGYTRNIYGHFLELFAAASEFRPAECREYGWHGEYTSGQYVDLLATHSDHRILPEDQRRALLDAVRDAIEAGDGRHGVDYVAVLCFARRA